MAAGAVISVFYNNLIAFQLIPHSFGNVMFYSLETFAVSTLVF